MSELAPTSPTIEAVREAQALGDRGELAAAERILVDLIPAGRANGPDDELLILGSLMTVYSRSGRRFESLVLSRRLANLARSVNSAEGAANLDSVYCTELTHFEAVDLLRPALRDLEASLAKLPDHTALMAREAFHHAHLKLAMEDKDEAAVERHLTGFESVEFPDETRPWRKPMLVAYLKAERDWTFGRPMEAVAHLQAADEIDDLGAEKRLLLARWVSESEYRIGAEDAVGALRAASRALSILQDLEQEHPLAPSRVRWGARLAAAFQALDRPDETQRTYDLTSAAVLERMAQLESCVRHLPELGLEGDPDEVALLTDLRRRFAHEQRDLLQRVAQFFEQQPSLPLAIDLSDPETYVVICAWCERLRADDGTWLPIGHFIPREGSIRISHGICEGCSTRFAG